MDLHLQASSTTTIMCSRTFSLGLALHMGWRSLSGSTPPLLALQVIEWLQYGLRINMCTSIVYKQLHFTWVFQPTKSGFNFEAPVCSSWVWLNRQDCLVIPTCQEVYGITAPPVSDLPVAALATDQWVTAGCHMWWQRCSAE